jgi:hypothetical protein
MRRSPVEDIAAFTVWLTGNADEATDRHYLAHLDDDPNRVILRGPNRFG